MAIKDVIDVTEQKRLNEAREAGIPWKKWGPYLSERQWGTVREGYSDNGAGLGASHQTGWRGLIAAFLDIFGRLSGKSFLETEKGATTQQIVEEQVGGVRPT